MKERVMCMRLTCLGVNGPFPAAEGATSGYLVQTGSETIGMDLGSGTLAALTALTPPEDMTALLLSHWHYDHCCDLLPLIFRLEAMGRPLTVYAPVDENSLVRRAAQACGMIRLVDVASGDVIGLGGTQVTVHQARHPVPAVMYRLQAEGRTLCYTGDTNTVEGLADFARGADLLLADGLFTAALWAEGKPHLSAELAAAVAAEAGVGKLVLTHLNPAIDPETLLREARAVRPDALMARRLASFEV